MKYLYSANIKGNRYECSQVKNLAKKINEAYDYPVVSNNVLYNYFTRSHKMKRRKTVLEPFCLKRLTLLAPVSASTGAE